MFNHEDQLQQTILGCLLTWPGEIDNVATILKTDDFYGEKYREVFSILVETGGGDLMTTTAALKGKAPAHELMEWISMESTAVYLPRYCQELKELATKRRLFDALGRIRLIASSGTSQEMLDKLETEITALTGVHVSEPLGAKELLRLTDKRLRSRYDSKGVIQGIPYGIKALDAATCGLHQGELIVIAGRPSMGKSALAGNILENVCRGGKSGILFSLEMDNGNCMDRLMSSVGGIRYGAIRSGQMGDNEWSRTSRAASEIFQYRMFMDDTPGISLRLIKSKCRKLKKGGLDVVVIDYLQLMSANPATTNRVQAIGEISRGLKQMARELECSVVLLSQLNRSVDGRPDKRPNMSDLRDSGEIEQDADVILFPFRPAAYCPLCKDNKEEGGHDPAVHKRQAEIIIEKQRNGERNISVPVVWMGEFQKFLEVV